MVEPPDTESFRRAKVIIKEYLGDVKALPMIFDPQCLCPECLWMGMVVHGNRWECPQCGFSCRATIVIDETGARWMRLLSVIGVRCRK